MALVRLHCNMDSATWPGLRLMDRLGDLRRVAESIMTMYIWPFPNNSKGSDYLVKLLRMLMRNNFREFNISFVSRRSYK